jgi:hypothetical protein
LKNEKDRQGQDELSQKPWHIEPLTPRADGIRRLV